jgi:DNA-binding PadR family transcriptional regulator
MKLEDEGYWDNLIKKSVSRFFLLATLNRRPMNGYEIAKIIETECEGCCKPTDAMIYPTIKEMLDGGYIECTTETTGGRQRKVCHLTAKGVESYRTASRVWAKVMPFLQQPVQEANDPRETSHAGFLKGG